MRRSTPFLAALAPIVVATAGGVGAQSPGAATGRGPTAHELAAADSEAVIRRARAAQAAFERARRRDLPRQYGSRSAPCGEIIGRFCYWDDDSTDDVLVRTVPPAESPRTTAARARLLATLDSASAALPHDPWIAGIQVHYLLEAGRLEQAAGHARACRADPWWCAALLGLAEHAAWRYSEADSAFARALAAMPDADRCAWTDLDVLLDDPIRGVYERTACRDRDRYDDRIWWLADPSWLRAGNDRRTEHFARMTRARIHRRSASGYAVAWRDDLDEIVRRFGWPSHFSQEVLPPHRTDGPRITAFHDSPSYHFLTGDALTDDVRSLHDTSWTLRPEQPRERYAPPYATFGRLTHQATLFRRGDSTLLVVAYDASADSLLRLTSVTGAVVATAGPPPRAEYRTVHDGAATKGTILLTLADTPAVASVELMAGARLLRARFGVGFPDARPRALRMSELAFFDPTDSVPAGLDGFLPLARASARIAAGSKLGLFWELYGSPASGDDLALEVEVVRQGHSWLRRAGERIGVVDRSAPVTLGWRESPRGDGITPRALVLDLRGLEPGSYRIEVSLTPDGQTPITAARRVEITR